MASKAKASGADKRDDADDSKDKAAPAPAKKNLGPLLMILGSTLFSAALASGVTWFVSSRHSAPARPAAAAAAAAGSEGDKAAADGGDKPAASQPALYLDLTPAFVVNLADEGSMRFLQVEVQVMARDPKVIDAVKDHMPRLRNALMMLFSQQHANDIGTRQAKEALQKQALDEIKEALQQENAPSDVGAIYFTSFVMQ
ncbi:MAG: flagellar basal body-associated FliL family protein [Nevskia sp.]|nr:flagellar basal body-associated FliL family protein [Nevskia sp.]